MSGERDFCGNCLLSESELEKIGVKLLKSGRETPVCAYCYRKQYESWVESGAKP